MPTAPLEIRLSPSGPFIADSDSDQPLQGGDGTPGLIWRAQGTAITATSFDPAWNIPAGLDALAWAVPPGYKYDIILDVQTVTCGIGDVLDCAVQYSEDNMATWLPSATTSVCRTITRTMSVAIGSAFFRHQQVRWDRTADGTAATTHWRVRFAGPATSSYSSAGCALRIFQYVD